MSRTRFRTQFCFVAPASMLDRYASHSRTHLVLPQVTNPQYVAFYQRKRREGDLIILDNGAYEGVDNFDLLPQSIVEYRPQVCVLPDFLLDEGERTYEASKEFLHEYRLQFPEVKWMYVPQSKPGDLTGWYKWLNIGLKTLKPDWIGIPRALATHISTGPNAWLERANAVEQLTMRGVKTHCLGMVNGNLKELEYLFWEGACSVDSSAPIWRGVNGFPIEQREGWDQKGTDVNFESPYVAGRDGLIKDNMNLVLKALGQERIK